MKHIRSLIQIIVLAVIVSALFFITKSKTVLQLPKKMIVTSNSFKNGEMIPEQYTCDGTDHSPHLAWKNFSKNTKSFTLICHDPDAPKEAWYHWVVFDIPASINEIPENGSIEELGGIEGETSWGEKKKGYGGPCPPSGTHRYFFTVYALDIKTVSLPKTATAKELLLKMENHILTQGHIMGRYQRKA